MEFVLVCVYIMYVCVWRHHVGKRREKREGGRKGEGVEGEG